MLQQEVLLECYKRMTTGVIKATVFMGTYPRPGTALGSKAAGHGSSNQKKHCLLGETSK